MAARTASREEIQAHLVPVVSPRTIGNRLLAVELRSRVSLARLPLTPRNCKPWLLWCHERVYWRVELCSVIFSDESRFCLYMSDGRTNVAYGMELVSAIFRNAFAHDTQAPHQVSWCVGAISYNLRSHLVFLQRKVTYNIIRTG